MCIMISNLSQNHIHIPKHILEALGVDLTAHNVYVAIEAHVPTYKIEEPVNTVPHYI